MRMPTGLTHVLLPLSSLAAEWRNRAVSLREWAQADGAARAFERAAEELESALRTRGGELLTLTEASREGGYSTRQLSRMIRNGRVRNAGTPTSPKILRADVPTKRGHLPSVADVANIARTPGQIARSFATQLRSNGDD